MNHSFWGLFRTCASDTLIGQLDTWITHVSPGGDAAVRGRDPDPKAWRQIQATVSCLRWFSSESAAAFTPSRCSAYRWPQEVKSKKRFSKESGLLQSLSDSFCLFSLKVEHRVKCVISAAPLLFLWFTLVMSKSASRTSSVQKQLIHKYISSWLQTYKVFCLLTYKSVFT